MDVITILINQMNIRDYYLPGVGNFDPAIQSIRDFSKTQFPRIMLEILPVLGICLGMEMFFEKSEEGKEKGLNVIDGEVIVLT